MSSRLPQATYPLGLTLFALFLAAYKAVSLTIDMGADLSTFLSIVGLDALFLSILFLIALCQGYLGLRWLPVILMVGLFFLILLYLVDCFVLLALDEHANLFDVSRYAPEWAVVQSFFDFSAYLAILLLLIAFFVSSASTPTMKRAGLALVGAAVFATGLSVASVPRPLQRYAMLSPHQLMDGLALHSEVTSYSDADMAFYASLKREAADIPVSRPDIILLVV